MDPLEEALNPSIWTAFKERIAGHSSKPDYGTGYYVRSTAHPVVSGPNMPLEDVYEALNAVDETYSE